MAILQELTRRQIIVLSTVALIIFVAASAAIYSCCHTHTYPQDLVVADSLCDSNPDSAVVFLKKIPKASIATDADRMYYNLLRIKLSNNLYEPQKDSTIFRIVDFFDDMGDRDKLRESYYYLGKYYVEHSDAPQALKCFHEALDLSDSKTPLSFRSKVYSQSGTLFLYQDMYKDALKMYQESYSCDSILNDTLNMVHGLRDIAQVYGILGKSDICENLLKSAYRMSNKPYVCSVHNSILLVLASQYLKYDKLSELSKILSGLLANVNSKTVSPTYCVAAKYFDKKGQQDSVAFYCQKLMRVGDVYAKEYASGKLVEYYSLLRNYSMTISYIKLNRIFTDSVRTVNSTDAVSRIHSLYNYNLREKEIQNLKTQNMQKTYVVAISVLVIIIVVIVMICLNERNKKQCLEYEKCNYQLKILYNSLVEKFQQESENKNKTITELRSVIERTLSPANETTEESNALKCNIYKIIDMKLRQKKGLTDTEWKKIYTAIDIVYPRFRNTIYSIYKVDEREYRICSLIKLGFRNVDISILMYRTKGATSLIRASLYEKFFNRKGSAHEFNEFINSL